MIIHSYTSQLLIPALNQHGISGPQAERVAEDIALRLRSVLGHWNNAEYRQTLLLIGHEEGAFYQPLNTKLETRALVVVTVRNSALEDISSVDQAAQLYGLPKAIALDAFMGNFTGAAITYFDKVDLSTVEAVPSGDDLFTSLPESYPVAWAAMKHLSNPSTVKKTYIPVPRTNAHSLISPQLHEGTPRGYHSVTMSGMDLVIDPPLRSILSSIADGSLPTFFTPSLKHLSRHPRKLLEIIDFTLSHGAALVTPNYYLSNGYVARRSELLKPIHDNAKLKSLISRALVGANGVHREALKLCSEQMRATRGSL